MMTAVQYLPCYAVSKMRVAKEALPLSKQSALSVLEAGTFGSNRRGIPQKMRQCYIVDPISLHKTRDEHDALRESAATKAGD